MRVDRWWVRPSWRWPCGCSCGRIAVDAALLSRSVLLAFSERCEQGVTSRKEASARVVPGVEVARLFQRSIGGVEIVVRGVDEDLRGLRVRHTDHIGDLTVVALQPLKGLEHVARYW